MAAFIIKYFTVDARNYFKLIKEESMSIKLIIKIIVFTQVLLIVACTSTQSLRVPQALLTRHEIDNCGVGCPTGSGSDEILIRETYTLNNSAATKFAHWVAYKITRTTQASGRPRHWKTDPDLPAADTLDPEDYQGASKVLNIDRGHQAPLASLAAATDWPSLNYLSNITPQKTMLNQGAWAKLENQERILANRADIRAVYTVTGPLYERNMGTLPNAKKPHRIPSGYWKIIFINHSPAVNHYATFILDQDTPTSANFCDFQATVTDVERRTGLVIWSGLPTEIQSNLKNTPGVLSERMGCAPLKA
ncbi:endonuclease [Yersinia ruckeri]|nr:DNA/RNA non-specific endonuclease [Yersinia ruckeri]AUQ42756.1 endonuclease [Yersinia ruckeri]MCW6625582.1 DNA/RNA non-specific endonuclease [Yersinia ruckeri]WMS04438.1 DNA/RNA non-specific endonuclease [Yersinia ruckeri]